MFFNQKLIINILSILIFLIPIGLVAGPFVADLFLVVFTIIFLITIFYTKNYKYINSKFIYFFLLFYFYILFVSLFSDNIYLSLESSLFYFRFGLFSVGVWYVLDNNTKFFKYFFYILLFTFIIVIFDAYFQFFTGTNLFGFPKDEMRISGLFKTELKLGSYLVRLYILFFAVSYFLSTQNKRYIYIAFILFVLVDVLVYLTGERTAFFLLFLHFMIIVFLISGLRKLRIFTFVFSIFIIFGLSIYFPESKNRMVDDTFKQLNLDNIFIDEEINEKLTTKNLTNDRQRHTEKDEGYVDFWADIKSQQNRILAFSPHHELTYNLALTIFRDNMIFGIGPKMFREVCTYEKYFIQYGCTSHPHNTYIQLLTETGLIGFLFVFLTFIYISFIYTKQFLSNFINIKKINDNLILFIAPLFITLWPIVPSGNFFNNWLSIIYFLPIGFILYFYNKK